MKDKNIAKTLGELKSKAISGKTTSNFKKTKINTQELEDKIINLQEELETLNKKLEDQATVCAKWEFIAKKSTADLQNVMTQHNIDLANKSKTGKKSVALNILPFLNTLRLAFEYLPSDLDPKSDKFINTLKSSYQKALDDLESQNIKIIVPVIGNDFDSATMSAISATDDEHKITQIVELGMIIDGQIFKPAAVIC